MRIARRQDRGDMKTQITTVEQLKRTMFEFQVSKRWIGIEKILRRALGKPDPSPGTVVKARISGCLKKVLTVLISAFTVDEKGAFSTKGVFNNYGFRKCGYRMFGRWMSQRTIAWAIGVLRELGIITAYQERNPDGSWGDWWVRLNPDILIYWAEFKAGFAVLSGSAPLADTCALSSSSQNTEASASQFPEKKKSNTPGVCDFSSKDIEDFEAAAKKAILATPVGKIVEKLKPYFPDMDKLTVKQLLQLERIVCDPVPQKRLNEQTVSDLAYIMIECPEALGRFSSLARIDVLLDYWNTIIKSIWQWRLARHDRQMDDLSDAKHSLSVLLFEPGLGIPDPNSFDQNSNDRNLVFVRCLALALTHKWSARLASTFAAKASNFLRSNPHIYKMMLDRFPQIRVVCDIPRSTHLHLLEEARSLESNFSVWSGIKDYYGFEF